MSNDNSEPLIPPINAIERARRHNQVMDRTVLRSFGTPVTKSRLGLAFINISEKAIPSSGGMRTFHHSEIERAEMIVLMVPTDNRNDASEAQRIMRTRSAVSIIPFPIAYLAARRSMLVNQGLWTT